MVEMATSKKQLREPDGVLKMEHKIVGQLCATCEDVSFSFHTFFFKNIHQNLVTDVLSYTQLQLQVPISRLQNHEIIPGILFWYFWS